MKKSAKILLILIACVCFGVALSYPIGQYLQGRQNEMTMDLLTSLRNEGLEEAASIMETPVTEELATDAPTEEPAGEPEEDRATDVSDEQPATDVTGAPTSAPADVQTDESAKQVNEPTEQPAADNATAEPAKTEATQPVNARTDAPTDGQTEPNTEDNTQPETDRETAQPASDADAASQVSDQTSLETAEPTQEITPEPTPVPTPRPSPSPTPDRHVRTGALPWSLVEKTPFDASKILMQYRKLYEMNTDMVGWLTIPGTYVDYPVMQSSDDEFYLSHDFFKKDNENGLLILDGNCDPYTPSYNLVVSGHNRWNKQMFSNLSDYQNKWYWEQHKLIQFDSLMETRTYVVFAAFFAADYAEGEEGFRYNANIQYSVDADQWLENIRDYQMYDTGIDAEFGDQFLTLTTCNSSRRKNGRFVVMCRRVRDGEVIE